MNVLYLILGLIALVGVAILQAFSRGKTEEKADTTQKVIDSAKDANVTKTKISIDAEYRKKIRDMFEER